MAELPTIRQLAARVRAGEAVVTGEMRDFCDGRVVLGHVGGIPVILGTPQMDAEFTALWLETCEQAGIRPQEVPDGG